MRFRRAILWGDGILRVVGLRIDAFFWQGYNDAAWWIDLILFRESVRYRLRRPDGGCGPCPRASPHRCLEAGQARTHTDGHGH